jgi:hypothetical protein
MINPIFVICFDLILVIGGGLFLGLVPASDYKECSSTFVATFIVLYALILVN